MLSLPVKLTVSFLLIAICISSISGIVPLAEEKVAVATAEDTADRIDRSVTNLWYSEIGDRLTVCIDLPPGCSLEIHGDGQKAIMMDIMYYGEKSESVYLTHPVMIPNDRLVLTDGCYLTLEKTDGGVKAL